MRRRRCEPDHRSPLPDARTRRRSPGTKSSCRRFVRQRRRSAVAGFRRYISASGSPESRRGCTPRAVDRLVANGQRNERFRGNGDRNAPPSRLPRPSPTVPSTVFVLSQTPSAVLPRPLRASWVFFWPASVVDEAKRALRRRAGRLNAAVSVGGRIERREVVKIRNKK